MRSVVAKELRKKFSKMFIQKYPFFKETKDIDVPPGCRVYQRKYETGFIFFLILIISPKADNYTLEFGWNRENKVPNYNAPYISREKFITPEEVMNIFAESSTLCARLGRLTHPMLQIGKVYVLGRDLDELSLDDDLFNFDIEEVPLEESLKNLEESLIDVMEKLNKYIIPLFKRVAERNGLKLEE
ncbi:hypothetical protein RBH29_12130 [Herbivorax sp. ANBcel31]|uniref:hypothetical protein n=1 Tax=Herbivorax sp. ANBcel31 TaxID=3069754 RepID=UPI0027B18C20|nr:hypothetical protein [Herbivorax sp. ANBcel31]MDQ2087175.1 hypothetical protein [Herbivorax sp. ANBcel31]